MNCKNCQAEIPGDSNVCPWCGAKILPDAEDDAVKTEKAAPETEEPVNAVESTAKVEDAGGALPADTAEPDGDAQKDAAQAEDAAAEDANAVESTAAEDAVADENAAATGDTGAPENADKPDGFEKTSFAEAAPGSNKRTVAIIAVLSLLLVVCLGALAFLAIRSMRANNPPAETEITETDDAAKVEDAFPDGFDYSAVDLAEYVTLGDYKGITVSLTTSSEITDKDIADYIENVLAQNTVTNEVDRAAQNGDELVIDFIGRIDGVAFDGGTAQDQELTLGGGGYIDGFEEGIVGMRAGETKVVDAIFPEAYGNEELNGKTAQFEITVKSVGEKVKPEYNETFVKEVLDYDSVEAYEESVRERLAEQREQVIETEKQNAALAQINENATVLKYPQGLAENYAAQQIASAKSYAEMYGVDYDTFVMQGIGMTAAAYEESVLEDAREYVKETMVLFAIAKAEDLLPTESQRAEELGSFLSYYGYEDIAAMSEDYGITETYIRNLIDTSIATNSALEFVINNATFIGAK